MADIGELVIQIRASAEGVETAMGAAMQSIQRFVSEAEASGSKASFAPVEKGLEGVGTSAEDMKNKVKDAWDNISKEAKSALKDIVQAVGQGIAAYQAYQTAMMGLQSVAAQNGVGSLAVKEAVDKVSDAFLDSASAAAAYKNLLTRGFSLDQATNTILRLKEAAAFGRQANLGFAQSIVAATEGIKSENNALVSNAGVTKSVAKMWQDYAKARGVAHQPFRLALAA